MIPAPFTPPPTVRRPRSPAPPRHRLAEEGDGNRGEAMLRASGVTLAGIIGFLGLLIAGSLVPEAATPLRVLALMWFAVLDVWYVRASARIP